MRKGFWKGLKVFELVIMAIIAVMLVGVVFYRYDSFACRSMQSEAKFSLQEIYAAQKLYHAQHDRFAPLEKLHIEEGRVAIAEKYYHVSDAEVPTKDTFKVVARGVSKTLVEGEIWVIDHLNNLVNQHNACQLNE